MVGLPGQASRNPGRALQRLGEDIDLAVLGQSDGHPGLEPVPGRVRLEFVVQMRVQLRPAVGDLHPGLVAPVVDEPDEVVELRVRGDGELDRRPDRPHELERPARLPDVLLGGPLDGAHVRVRGPQPVGHLPLCQPPLPEFEHLDLPVGQDGRLRRWHKYANECVCHNLIDELELVSGMADEEQSLGRRTVLKTTPAVVGGVVGLAGCTSPFATGGPGSVSLLSAGSLARTFEDHVGPAFESETGTVVYGEYYGSNAIMRLVEDGTEFPDVVVSADARLLRDRLYGGFTSWDVVFAANSLGIGYREGTELGRALDRGEPWYEVALGAEPGEVAIADPDLDPLGYRAVQAFELAAAEHGLDGFREAMLDRVYLEPEEPQLLAGVEAGARAAGLVYRNMALDRDLPFLEFPDAYNFARPDRANHYATVSYTTDDGYTARGRPILYNATVLEGADNPDAGRRLVGFLLDNPGLLDEAGLTVTGRLPQPGGDVPEAVGV